MADQDTTPDDERPGGMNYESPWHKGLRYAVMPVTVPLMLGAFMWSALKYSITGKNDPNDTPP